MKGEQVGLASDAASLISQGDSLVYTKHKTNPALANHLQTRYQDKLRNKWSKVMSEIETKRNIARKAEDDLKECNSLTNDLQKWLAEIKAELQTANNYNYQSDSLREEFKMKERDVLKLNELARELKQQRIGFPDKLVGEMNVEWIKVAEQYATISAPSKDKEKHAKNVGKIYIFNYFQHEFFFFCLQFTNSISIIIIALFQEAIAQKGSEFVTKVNKAREAVSAISRQLNAHPLNGQDYDEFPQQEDSLLVRFFNPNILIVLIWN